MSDTLGCLFMALLVSRIWYLSFRPDLSSPLLSLAFSLSRSSSKPTSKPLSLLLPPSLLPSPFSLISAPGAKLPTLSLAHSYLPTFLHYTSTSCLSLSFMHWRERGEKRGVNWS